MLFQYRTDFPILQNSDVAYLDSASSAQKPQVVIDAYQNIYQKSYANIHRGLYKFSQDTTTQYEAVREKVRSFINAQNVDEVIFTRNTTESINLVASSWGETFLKAGDEIIISEMEHHANIVPWQLLSEKIGVVVKVVPVLDDGTLDMSAFKNLLNDKTKLIGIVHISNALGIVNDVKAIVQQVKSYNSDIKILVDGTQSVIHGAVNIQEICCDFFCFTGHKLYGPNGVGVLWAKSEILNAMPPYQGGGDMIETVSFDNGTTFKNGAAKFEAGTPAIAEVIALGVAIDYVRDIGLDNIAAHEAKLLTYMSTQLNEIDGLTIHGTHNNSLENKAAVVSFTADWAHTSDIAMILDQCNVAVRTGHHCCMPLMHRFGIDGTIRASLGLYSNENDIDMLVGGINKAKEMLS